MRLSDYSSILNSNISWKEFLGNIGGIKEIIDLDNLIVNTNRHLRFRSLMVKNGNTFYELRFGIDYIDEISQEFEAFNSLPTETKNIIFDALAEMRSGLMIIMYIEKTFVNI